MRLINTETLILEEFFEDDIPHYAILSHTWGPEEVTFQDWLYVTKQNPATWGWVYLPDEIRKIKAKMGYAKITAACQQAKKEFLDWIWVDTTCIDKTNLAELSEAINSMFRWYRGATMCYVFLADVSSTTVEECHKENSDFRNSRWFQRGWTLQELIAPLDLVFFSNQWKRITRRELIASTVRDITKIPTSALTVTRWNRGQASKERPSITEIMSWAANRKTTRIEDQAYCLLGLFDINMPLLYGEGSKAFLRLQLEILQRTTDLSFLAWQEFTNFEEIKDLSWKPFLPALASKPHFFSGAEHAGYKTKSWAPISLTVTNLGLSLRLPLVQTLDPNLSFAVLLPLSRTGRAVWMPLWQEGDRYFRIGFISTTLMVPHCPFETEAREIVLPIYDVGSDHKLDLSSLHQPPSSRILLTFPLGLKQYRVLDRVTAPFEPPDSRFPRAFQWHDLLLHLVTVKDDPHLAYGAIEFEGIVAAPFGGIAIDPFGDIAMDPFGDTDVHRVAVLFISRLDDFGKPTIWTCVDIGQHSTGASDLSLDMRAMMALSEVTSHTASVWKQDCSLQGPRGHPGRVIMDDLERNLSASEFGGYRVPPADWHIPFNRHYFPILAQIVFPPQRLG